MSDEREPMIEQMQVAVIGAGPAGLTAALALARAGIDVHVLERRLEASAAPRATALSTATMELMRASGLEARVREGELDVELRPWVCESLAAAHAGHSLDAGFPTREQGTLVSPTGPACVPQDHLEPVLEAHLRTLAGARVQRGVTVTDIVQDSGGVELVIDSTRRVRCRWAIAADGVHGTARDLLGIPVSRADDLGDRLALRFRAPLWALAGDRRAVLYVITGLDRPTFLVPAGGDRWVLGAEWTGDEDLDPERGADLVRRATGAPDLPVAIEHAGRVGYGVHLAERLRAERVFLAGDAAHRVTPRGATGLNTAIADGADLGRRLAWVLRGWAGEDLLDGYEAERRPVAEHATARSADPGGSEHDVTAALGTDLGGRIPHVWLTPGVSTLDLLGDGLTLFTGPQGPAEPDVRGRAPVTVRRLDAMTARALGIDGDGALLVRPDGRPVTRRPATRIGCAA